MKQYDKKNRFLLLLALMLCLLLFQTLSAAQAASSSSVIEDGSGILRLHIRANSNSRRDQEIKLKVRDALLPYFEQSASYEDAREYLLENGRDIQSICESVLLAEGADYGVYLQLGTETFPDRTYEGTLYPAGDYDALIVVLGSGGGQNWWCVLYPPLCIVTPDGETVDTEDIEFESGLWKWLSSLFEGWSK
ncbi:MAG: stage II sporulation protein R [Clostridia bacterium]|nr:stage II sporulation protein R [Clostridia bacterium]